MAAVLFTDDPTRAAQAHRWAAVTDALAGLRPFELTILEPEPGVVSVDTGVWARAVRADPRAPRGLGVVSGIAVTHSVFAPPAMRVAASPPLAEFLRAALAAAGTLELPDDRAARRVSVSVAGFDTPLSLLSRLRSLAERCELSVSDTVPAPGVIGHLSPRARFGAAAEAAYHAFAEREGFGLVSTDGSARLDGAWAWAWWAAPDRWASGGGLAGTSLHAELTAATEALRAHPDRPLALTYDCRAVRDAALRLDRTSLGRAGLELAHLIDTRPPAAQVVWFPLSSGSASKRQWHVDDLATRTSAAAASTGALGPWSAATGVPDVGGRPRRPYPHSVPR